MADSLKILFAGTPVFAAAHLSAVLASRHTVCAVLTQPDRRAGRGKKLIGSPVKQMATDAGIEVLQPTSLKTPETQQLLRDHDPDVMVVVAYGLILPQAVLDIPRFGCLNVHASVLPRWRGAAPIQRAIEAGDDETGVTIMQMEAGLDTGPMLSIARQAISACTTGGQLHDQLADIGPPALLKVLDDLPGALNKAQPQDDTLATYAAKIDKTERALNWAENASSLGLKIRAFAPAPGCFSELEGQRIKILAATATPDMAPGAPPGTIVSSGRDGLGIACGSGVLWITCAQAPGGRALPISELLNGQRERFATGRVFTTPCL